ncbi:hypothetical protein RB195_011706 [Necator americanus]|uniref:Uncharacterized protein n=1 Tax=Necator americanus TaxID=51031 RepID=A0ABR1D3U0_NECAM
MDQLRQLRWIRLKDSSTSLTKFANTSDENVEGKKRVEKVQGFKSSEDKPSEYLSKSDTISELVGRTLYKNFYNSPLYLAKR